MLELLMDKRTVTFATFAGLVLLVAGLYFFTDWFSKATGYALGEDQKVSFANCLKDKKTSLYLSPNCLDCDKQREVLGEQAYEVIDKVVCDEKRLCGGLKSVPAWNIEGKFYYGLKKYKEIDELSSCEIV